ncbi:MAG: ribonuclease R [Planctomycetia bacterium]|nr:ribonuclease R [Planctomycetia bacterium]
MTSEEKPDTDYDTELERSLLELLAQSSYRPVKPRKIAKQLHLSEEQLQRLKRIIKRLVKQGRVSYGENHAVGLATARDINRITGVFRRVADGYGFVRPTGTPRSAERSEDIFIPANRTRDAVSGDTVAVRMIKRSGGDDRGRGRSGAARRNGEGEIIEVVERETHQFVGTYFESAGGGFVQVDGTLFTNPVYVGDAGAKNARPDDKVVFEMVRFPSHSHDGEGVTLEVLGPRGAPGVDTLSIIREFNLPGEFAEDALDDARAVAAEFDESVGPGRVDLTKETIITIDPVDARDFDDAISLVEIERGHWRLGVHIADVSHFVREKSALDREGRDRATSIYLPDRVIPMLPEIISNNLASLQPDKVRYTKTVFIEFSPEGIRVGADPCSAAIKSARRFTYEEVDDYLADPPAWRKKLTPEVHALLGRMHTLAMILRARRFKRGALELSLPEVKIDLDGDGRVSGAHLVENTVSHQIIEEFMLAANEAVADILHDQGLAFLRRVHEPPDPLKLKQLTDFVKELGQPVQSLESRFEIQDLLDRVKGAPEEHAINYATLRSMQKAIYSPQEAGHFALASECYCHFTSPIRRYPDLTVHRLLDALITKKKPRSHFDELSVIGDHCSEREQRAEKAERELIKVKLLHFMSTRIGEEFDAVITGVQNFGLFAQGIKLPAEGIIHVASLQEDFYKYDRASHTLSGYRSGNSYRLGDLVRVAVARVDIERRELDFRLVGRLKGRPPGPPKKHKHGAAGASSSGANAASSGGDDHGPSRPIPTTSRERGVRGGKPPGRPHKSKSDRRNSPRGKPGKPRRRK